MYLTQSFTFNRQFLRLLQGCSSPIVVKFADTQKEKDQKRIQQATTNLWGIGGIGIGGMATPQYLTVYARFITQSSTFFWRFSRY